MADGSDADDKPPHLAGKVIIPDMSAAQAGQMDNVKVMGEVSENAATALQEIIANQQSAFTKSVGDIQAFIKSSSVSAGLQPPELNLKNMEDIANQFSQTANKMTEATNLSYEKISQSVEASMAKIEETAKKFSGG